MPCEGCRKARERLLAARSSPEAMAAVKDAVRINIEKTKEFWAKRAEIKRKRRR